MFAYVYVVGGAREGGGGWSGEEERKGVWSSSIIFFFFRLLALQMGLKESGAEGAYNECYDCFKSVK